MTATMHKISAGDGYTYLTKQVAAMDATGRGRHSLADYYSARGEHPGTWTGIGLTGLNMTADEVVTEAQMKALFGEGRHPNADLIESEVIAREIACGAKAKDAERVAEQASRLGTPFKIYTKATDFRVELAKRFTAFNTDLGLPWNAAIDHSERARIRTELALEMFTAEYGREPLTTAELSSWVATASRMRTTAIAGYDFTFSPVKSFSALWAVAPPSLKAKLELAHRRAVAGAVELLEQHAAYTSIGANGIATLDIRGLIVATFEHRDSRAGDPDLHTHCVVSGKVETLDGRWRALDGCPIHRWVVAASETYNTLLEAESRELAGIEYADREPASEGKRPIREVIGVDPRLCAFWSSRSRMIERRRGQLTREFQLLHGREPSPVEALKLAQQANLQTRTAKHELRSEHEQRAAWCTEAEAVLDGADGVAGMVHAATHTRVAPVPDIASVAWIGATADRILTAVATTRATWQLHHLVAEAHRQARAAGVRRQNLPDAIGRLVTAASHPFRARRLGTTGPLTSPGPNPVCRRNGSSIYEKPDTQLWTSAEILAAEHRLLATTELNDAGVADATSVGIALLEYQANNPSRHLNLEQQALVREIATTVRRVIVALAPAGTGKTTSMRVLTRAWQLDGGTVLGLAPTGRAAGVLRDDIDTTTATLDALATALCPALPGTQPPDWVTAVDHRTLVIIDEAAKSGTLLLDQVVTWLLSRGVKIAMIGDDHQLSAVAAGGIVRDLAHATDALSLSRVVRFTTASEGPASLALRGGDPASLGFYLDHDRVHVGDLAAMEEDAYQAWRIDTAAGLDSVMLAPTNAIVDALNIRAHTDHLATLDPATLIPTVTCSDGLEACVGDIICTRHNDRRLVFTATDHVRNGYRWTIQTVHDDGSLTVTHHGTRRRLHLPAVYVRDHTTLGYATTADAAQGITVHTAHAVGIDTLSRAQLYVMLTRGTLANHLYQATALPGDEHSVVTDRALRPQMIADHWQRILNTDGTDPSATTLTRQLTDPFTRLAPAADAYTDAIGRAAEHLTGPTVLAVLDAAADRIHPNLTQAPAWPVLRRHLAVIYLTGRDPVGALQQAAAQRELDTADDPAAVLDWRLDPTGQHTTPGHGPLPWLPEIPGPLASHTDWAPYLSALRQFVTAQADAIRRAAADRPPETAPQWAQPLITDPSLISDLTVWRAARRIPDTDHRSSGPTEFATLARRYQQELDNRITRLLGDTATSEQWTPLVTALEPRLITDPYWPVVAARLTIAENAGGDIAAALAHAVTERPLPSLEPAAALWWRLNPDLPDAGPLADGSSNTEPPPPPDPHQPVPEPVTVATGTDNSSGSAQVGPASRFISTRTTTARVPLSRTGYNTKRTEHTMNTKSSFENITAALERVSGPGRKTGIWYRYLCPVHEADGRHHNPSLGITYNQSKQRTVVRCFAGCSDEDILDRLGLHVRDLFDQPPDRDSGARHAPTRRAQQSTSDLSPADQALLAAGLPLAVYKPDLGPAIGLSREVAAYLYEWPDHRQEGRVHRIHSPHEHGRAKHFWQEHMTENGWQRGGFAHIPYQLPDIVAAVAAGQDIYICEGEEDVHSVIRAGAFATTNAGGAQAWTQEHAEWLRGAHRVWIVADRDAPGYRRAGKVADSLTGLVTEVRIVQARDGKDITDHLNAGHQLDELDPVPVLDEYALRSSAQRQRKALNADPSVDNSSASRNDSKAAHFTQPFVSETDISDSNCDVVSELGD